MTEVPNEPFVVVRVIVNLVRQDVIANHVGVIDACRSFLLPGPPLGFEGPGTALWIANADGSHVRELLPEKWHVADPDWSSRFEVAFVAGSGERTYNPVT